jgi:hypothetical protein
MIADKVATLPAGNPQFRKIAELESVTQADAAEMVNVSLRSVQHARTVRATATPEMIAAVEQGRVSVSLAAKFTSAAPDVQRAIVAKVDTGVKPLEAARQVKAETIAARRIAQPTGRYRVLYADPPWQYRNSMSPGAMDARDHYPTMPLADICALPIRHLAEDDATSSTRCIHMARESSCSRAARSRRGGGNRGDWRRHEGHAMAHPRRPRVDAHRRCHRLCC